MKKRFVSVLLVFCMVLSLFPAAALAANENGENPIKPANPFTDVKEGDWFYDAVQYAQVNGFFTGISKTTFDPNGTMTRGMFVTVLGRMAGVDAENYQGQSTFTDVSADAYYAPFVAWATKHGITTGTGDGAFSPDALIDRAQMAVFFVRYFDAFDVDYETGANITTIPADIDRVPSWAKDAALKLWKQGLLNGDGTNFNPTGNASRAQAATLCMRTDEAVDTWYKEPGVESDRVSIDPSTGETVSPDVEEEQQPTSGGGSSGGISGGSSTRYYKVKFALGSDQSDITLPATATYPAGTLISSLPTPGKAGAIFLGWYYDAAMTDGVETDDVVDRNMTLYAKVAAGEDMTSLETPNYLTQTEVAAGTYTFTVLSRDNIPSAIRFIHITGGNIDVEYSVNGTQVTATLEAGQTYQVELLDDTAQFQLNGESEAQPASIRYLNILTAKSEAKNAELNGGVKQIPVEHTSGLSSDVFDGLYQIDETGAAARNKSSGTFTYTGDPALQVGDTVAITSGNVDLTDVTSTEGDVAYVKITAENGTTYSYEMAELEDVLFIPDVLPIQSDWDTDNADDQITISAENMTAAMSNVEADSLDVGDFLGFLAADVTYREDATVTSYGEITHYTTDDSGNYVITYTTADIDAVEGALDVYYTQDRKIELTEEEKSQIENEVKNDVQDSGYVEEAALYLASVMLESDNLEEIPDMEQVAYSMHAMRDSSVQYDNGSVTRADDENTVTVSFDEEDISVGVSANSQLDHLDGAGFDVLVEIPFVVTIAGSDDNKLQIKVTAEFEEEILLNQKISTSRHKIGFLRYDYSLNASFDVGTYTGIGFTANIYTDNSSDDDSDEGSDDSSDDSSSEALAEKLEAIMARMEEYQDGGTDLNDGTMNPLSEIYQDVMERANDTWIDILDVKLFETDGSAFLHIFCWQVQGSFVVSANLCASMGMSFDYTMQKQYNFSVRVKAKTATNEVIDIVEPQYNFNFYVVGTLGIRAGLRLEMYVGLISLSLDKVGIMADVGAYTQLWGYFSYHLNWTQNSGQQTDSAGAMLIEIGIYLDIKFVAQLFNNSELTWEPTLYAHEWPLWSAGERQNVYAFQCTDDTNYTWKTTTTLALPGSTYEMRYMDLKDGETGAVNKDDAAESSFIISFTNPAFSYAPATNTVTVTPTDGSLAEETDMVITWKKAPLSFTSTPLQKIIRLSWSDPEGMRYISFDSTGGSAVAQLSGGSGAAITWPAEPTKQGYEFAGWYTDSSCTAAYSGSTTEMPAFPEGTKGMTLYAKWTPAEVSYTVEHYLEELNCTYTLDSTQTNLSGTAGTQTNALAYTVYTGFTGKPIEQQTIAADGSTVVKVYYDRNHYTVTFEKNDGSGESLARTCRYGEAIVPPILAREGYILAGWNTASDGSGDDWSSESTVSGDVTYYARWEATTNRYTVTWVVDGTTAETDSDLSWGTPISFDGAEPTKDATAQYTYTFAGWNTASDGSGDDWSSGSTVSGNVTYYAQWEATTNRYTVTWDLNGGSTLTGEYTGGSADYGTTIIAPTPTRNATAQYTYTFAGWYTAAEGGDQVTDFGTVTGDVTYYARWQEEIIHYELYIGGTEFTSNTLTISGDSGTATFDPDTFTLTLDSFSLTAAAPLRNGASGLLTYTVSDSQALNIVLIGDNLIENTYAVGGSDISSGIYVQGDLNISGEGSLTCIGGPIDANGESTGSSHSSGICCSGSGTLTVDISGTLTAKGQTADLVYGIFYSKVHVKSGAVEAIAETADTNTPEGGETGITGSYGWCGNGFHIYSGAKFTAQGDTQALKFADGTDIVFGDGITNSASENYDGTNSDGYMSDNNNSYKWYCAS